MKEELLTFWNLKKLQKSNKLSLTELKKLQLKNFKKMISYIYKNVPYYQTLFHNKCLTPNDFNKIEDITKIPLLTKKDIQKDPLKFISKEYHIKNLIKSRTSGSTGMPLVLYEDHNTLAINHALRYRALYENGFSLKDRIIEFSDPRHISNKKSFITHFGVFNKRRFSVFNSPEKNISELKSFKPTIIMGYPSVLFLTSQYILNNKIKLNFQVKRIFTSAEMLSLKNRKIISKAFNCDIIDLYGSTEFPRLAWECEKHKGYHINIDQYIVEFVPSGIKNCNKIVVTSLNNFVMPLIRYELGDYGKKSNDKCSCNRFYPLMKEIKGRIDDILILPSGREISPRSINALEYFEGISSYRTVQTNRKNIIVEVVKAKNFSKNVIKQIKKEILNGCFNEKIIIKVKIVKKIKREKNGKIKTIISKVKKNG